MAKSLNKNRSELIFDSILTDLKCRKNMSLTGIYEDVGSTTTPFIVVTIHGGLTQRLVVCDAHFNSLVDNNVSKLIGSKYRYHFSAKITGEVFQLEGSTVNHPLLGINLIQDAIIFIDKFTTYYFEHDGDKGLVCRTEEDRDGAIAELMALMD